MNLFSFFFNDFVSSRKKLISRRYLVDKRNSYSIKERILIFLVEKVLSNF